jgi:hypothetical protein
MAPHLHDRQNSAEEKSSTSHIPSAVAFCKLSLTRCVGEVWHLCSIRAFVRSLPLICKTVAREALESLYESMHGAIGRLKFNWLSESRGVCNWQGV